MTDWKSILLENELVFDGMRKDPKIRAEHLPNSDEYKTLLERFNCAAEDICTYSKNDPDMHHRVIEKYTEVLGNLPPAMRTIFYNNGGIHILTDAGVSDVYNGTELRKGVNGRYRDEEKFSITNMDSDNAIGVIFHEAAHGISAALNSPHDGIALIKEAGFLDAVMGNNISNKLANHPAILDAYKTDLENLENGNGVYNAELTDYGSIIYKSPSLNSREVTMVYKASHYLPEKYGGDGDSDVPDHLDVYNTEEAFAEVMSNEILRRNGNQDSVNLSTFFPNVAKEANGILDALDEIYNEEPKPVLTESANDPLYEQGSAFNFGR